MLELHLGAINSIPSKAHMELDLHSSGFEIEVAEKQEIAKLGYDIAVIYEIVNLEVKIYASELYTEASRTPASCWSFTTARSAGCSALPVAAVPPSGPNSNPLALFPQIVILSCLVQGIPEMDANGPAGAAGNLDFLRNSPHFQALRAMVQANPQILQESFDSEQFQDHHSVKVIISSVLTILVI
uniref:XPC-binding domain-containing protein n=1 Tax=Lactuca sativa TaxID=4236 RepID=A0A9R1WPG9_LACSA|nr:hypothetical protein LSAT_V11C100047570 [Lactuca sativa]